ncbi:MAG TPA: isocitrate lyase/phosphoenolpyruvate mutase family protein [Xanthobacteraceae bacterium]|nr:isocitrate lyase/phosphoenolpyruvate mutase family protein [Xanthobacteraceae bacterium]
MPTVAERRRTFRTLHERGCFVIPNPWDVGSARYLQHLGFKALASTSAGFAFAQGLPDNGVSRDMALAHLREIVAATDVPVNADFEGGFADAPDGVAESVTLCVATGVAGLSIEDSTGDKARPLYDFDLAVARVRAARAAIDQAGGDVVFTARTEGFLVGRPDIDETIRRLKAFAAAGADCLYAPGLRTRELIAAVTAAVAPKPVNVIMSAPLGITVADLEGLGVRRISVGSAFARVVWGALMRCAKEVAEQGRFDSLAGGAPHGELNAFFAADIKTRA